MSVLLSSGNPASKPADRSASAHSSGLVVKILEDRHQSFRTELARVRRRASEPGIHDLRVAARRLIAVIELIGCLRRDPRLAKQKRALRNLLKGSNALRDAAIQRLVLRRIGPAVPAATTYLRVVRLHERRSLIEAMKQVRGFDLDGLTAAVCGAQDSLLTFGLLGSLDSAARLILLGGLAGSFARAVRRRQDVRPTDPSSVHKLRVAFKRFRYSMEVLAPYLPWMDTTLRKKLNAYQTAMGELQDLSVLLEGIAKYNAARPITNRMSMIQLREFLLRRRVLLMQEFLEHVDALYGFWKWEQARTARPPERTPVTPAQIPNARRRSNTATPRRRHP